MTSNMTPYQRRRSQTKAMRTVQWPLQFWLLLVSHYGFSQSAVDWDDEADLLEQNRTRWESTNIDDYSIVLDKGCFGCFWYYPAKIIVKNGEIVEILDPDTDAPLQRKTRSADEGVELVYPGHKDRYHTIDGIFLQIEAAIANNDTTSHPGTKASHLRVEYDQQYGFPVLLSVSYDGGISVDGSEFSVTDGGSNFQFTQFVPAL